MKFTVTKNQVIKALKTEPLRSGYFFNQNFDGMDFDDLDNNAECPVCAVGAILDQKLKSSLKKVPQRDLNSLAHSLVTNPTVDDYLERNEKFSPYSSITTLVKFLSKKAKYQPLSALSSLFEALQEIHAMKTKTGFANAKTRKILVKFVEDNFPSRLEIDTKKRY